MSRDDFKDTEALVDVLRADVPSAREQERVRLRLMAAGVIVASTGVPAAAAAASGGAGVAGGAWGAWATKLAATSWTTKLAVAAVASAVVAAPTAVLVMSPRVSRVSVEEGMVSARPHAAGAASATDGVSRRELAAERGTAMVGPGADKGAQPMAASVSVAPKTAPKAPRASAEPPRGSVPALSQPARATGTTTTQGDAASIPRQPQPTAASTDPDSTSRTAPEPAPLSAQSAPADDASGLPSPSAMPPPSVAGQPAKFYARAELARPQLAGVRRSPASELARETQLIERALAALRVDDVPAARSWLNLHAARYPDGLLSRDRERVLRRIEESSH